LQKKKTSRIVPGRDLTMSRGQLAGALGVSWGATDKIWDAVMKGRRLSAAADDSAASGLVGLAHSGSSSSLGSVSNQFQQPLDTSAGSAAARSRRGGSSAPRTGGAAARAVEQDGLSFDEFREALCRYAAELYPHGRGLAFSVEELISVVLEQRPNPATAEQFRRDLTHRSVRETFHRNGRSLRATFQHYAGRESSADARQRSTISISEFVSMVRETELLGKVLSFHAALAVFVHSNEIRAHADEGERAVYSPDTEMIFPEFLEAVARLGLLFVREEGATLAERIDTFIRRSIAPKARSFTPPRPKRR
jgi:hypothetical protein